MTEPATVEADAIEVLLIEDNPADAALVRRALRVSQDATFRIRHIERLEAIPAALASSPVDIVLADLGLPESYGIATLQALRKLAPTTPVVVLTGSGQEETRLEALRLGALDVVSKSGTLEDTLSKGVLYALARAQNLAQIHDIVESNSDASVVVDMAGEIVFVNRAAVKLFARERNELVGTQFGFPVTGRSAIEIEISDESGSIRTAELRAVELDWGGKGAYLASIRDVTDRKRAADLELRLIHADRLASIGQLAAGVAHEINNPAAFIQTNCALLLDALKTLVLDMRETYEDIGVSYGDAVLNALNDRLAQAGVSERLVAMNEMLEDCATGIGRIASTVKDLSSFSRIQRDRIELSDVNEVISAACNMVRHELRHRAELKLKLRPIPHIAMDRAKLTQLFVNLLVNAGHAIEHAQADDPEDSETRHRVEVVSRVVDFGLVVSVSDTGCGIPEEAQSRVFEPFFTTKSRDRGTGLGLSLAAETVRKHGGEILVESKLGEGTRFEVRLPLQTGLRVPEAEKERGEAPAPSSARVLIVDDEPLLRKALRRVLDCHEVIEADGGLSALEIIRRDTNFDLVISDLMMPGMSGAELFEAVSELHAPLAARMIFVTGGAVTKECRDFVERHAPIVVEKPVHRLALLELIEQFRR